MELTHCLFDIGHGDEAIVPIYTCTATASVVAHVGAIIVMVDYAAIRRFMVLYRGKIHLLVFQSHAGNTETDFDFGGYIPQL